MLTPDEKREIKMGVYEQVLAICEPTPEEPAVDPEDEEEVVVSEAFAEVAAAVKALVEKAGAAGV
jgi:hypothetical protein